MIPHNKVPIGTKRITVFNRGYIDEHYRWRIKTRSGWKLLSRVVAEKSLGRKLMRRDEVHHKDGNTLNDLSTNLEVLTYTQHRRRHCKLTIEKARLIRRLKTRGVKVSHLSKRFGVNKATIYCILSHRYWKED